MSSLTTIAEPRQEPTVSSRPRYKVSGWRVLRSE